MLAVFAIGGHPLVQVPTHLRQHGVLPERVPGALAQLDQEARISGVLDKTLQRFLPFSHALAE
jgi:hypothetical protein